MTPTNVLLDAMLDLIAADTGTLAAVAANKVSLVKAPFVPGPGLAIGDLTLATFTGSAAKTATAGVQPVAFDPLRGQWFVQLAEPAGGWLWTCTAAPAAAEVIYGVVLTNGAVAIVYGSQLLDAPVTIEHVGDSVFEGVLRFYLDPAALGD